MVFYLTLNTYFEQTIIPLNYEKVFMLRRFPPAIIFLFGRKLPEHAFQIQVTPVTYPIQRNVEQLINCLAFSAMDCNGLHIFQVPLIYSLK